MKKTFAAIALALATLSVQADEASVKKLLVAKFPKLGENAVFVKSMRSEGIEGLYEITLGATFGYTDEKVSYVFTKGEVLATKNMENLTAKRAQERIKEGIIALNPEKNAIKTVLGNGSRKIYVFSDPDCPYCKQFERELQKPEAAKLNATVYTFMYPLTSLHPDAIRKSENIWCAGEAKRKKVWTDWMTADIAIPQAPACKSPVQDIVAMGNNLGFNSTPSIVIADKVVIPGSVPVARLADGLDEIERDPNVLKNLR